MTVAALDDYLTVGFVAEPTAASDYVRGLLRPGPAPSEGSVALLCQIIEDATVKQGRTEVALPLSGGYDSRGLLGAAMQVLPANAIHCVTFGTERWRDMVVAAETCARLGLAHHRIDPNDVPWDLERLASSGKARWDRWGSLAPIDGIAVYDAMAGTLGDLPVLTGYLGGVISGAHLLSEDYVRPGAEVVTAFLRKNWIGALALGGDHDRLVTGFLDFVDRHGDLLGSWPGLTPFDLLDVGFRQNARIKATVCGAYAKYIAPYEDHRWIRHWLTAPVSDRVEGRAYRRRYVESFPDVFWNATVPEPESRRRKALATIKQRVPVEFKRAVRHPRGDPPPPRLSAARGDPRRNATMADALREMVIAFDRRQITSRPSALRAFENLMGEHPTNEDAATVKWAASAEMYLQLGVFGAPG